MRPIISLIRFFVYSNIFVAVCSVALTHLTYILLDFPKTNSTPILVLVFCATYFIYNMQRIVRLRYTNLIGKNIGIRLSWIVRNRALLFTTSLLLIIVSGISLLYVHQAIVMFLIPLAALSILYVIPFFPEKKKLISLRKLPFVKIFIISGVWTMVTVALPYINEYGFTHLNSSNFQLNLLSRFLFMIAITLPFDIRDLKFDRNAQLKTIPSVIGVAGTVILAEFILIFYAVIKWYQYGVLNQIGGNQLIALLISAVVCGVIISFARKKRPELYYSGLVESTMLILHFGVLVLEY